MRVLSFLVVGLLGTGLVLGALPRIDVTRGERKVDSALLFLPDGAQLKAAATGFEEAIADVMWVRSVLTFADRWENDDGTEWHEWFRRMVRAVTTLDPAWSTPYFYGGTMLRVTGDVEGSTLVFKAGTEALPTRSFFPFSVGMNAFLYDEDPATAAEWLQRAATAPDAPPWYAAAAAAMHQRAGSREAAIDYLERVAAATDSPAVKKDTARQLGRLRHDALVDSWAPVCREFEARNGRKLASADELAAIAGRALPENPRGDAWTVGADGVVRSTGAEKERVRRARMDEWALVRVR